MSKFQKEKLNEEEILRAYREKADVKKNRLANKNLVLENMKYEGLIQEQEAEIQQKETVNDFAKNLGIGRTKTRVHVMTERAKLETELTHKLFIESVFDTFYDALLLDESFKETYRGNLYKLTEQTINTYMQENNKSLNDIQNEACAAISEILEACKMAAKKTAEGKIELDEKKSKSQLLTEKKKKCEEETIKIDDGIKSDFDNCKKFHSRNISDLVQNKVVQVIDDEHKSAEDEEEYYESLDEKIQRKEAPADEELIGEMDNIEGSEDDEELDEANNATGGDVGKEVKDKDFDSKPPKDLKLAETLDFYKNKKKKLNETTLFKSLMISISKNNISQLKNEGSEVELDMNMVFAEAISHYTLLETLYTSKIMNLSTKDMKSFVTDIMITK